MNMLNNLAGHIKTLLFLITFAVFTAGCAGLNSGNEGYEEAVDAPTVPENIEEGYEEGAQYPEESF